MILGPYYNPDIKTGYKVGEVGASKKVSICLIL